MDNNRVIIKETEVLSDNWYVLNKITFDYLRNDGVWQTQIRESYDRGNGAAVFMFNKQTQNIILIRQFRMPSFLNGNESGFLIETCAGLLDKDNPEDCIKKEIREETGYQIQKVTKVFEAYMTPGAVTEQLHCFIAEYSDAMKLEQGGGLAHEQEDIEVLEMPFTDAIELLNTGKITDAKTIMLLQYAIIHKLMG
ncbi:GDP-mannose pyrophosphatase NudK [uncultured Polaribacter sp.]|uniref:GDP-mannose pyrophosphatase NudK n=1 Tax=uncultured Polaribacter sp. TaxID=174711 RepID=UPI002624ECB4|nr:GDP-mannose pyrophosphatase NudK [uncultured Polaribacter sp.]